MKKVILALSISALLLGGFVFVKDINSDKQTASGVIINYDPGGGGA